MMDTRNGIFTPDISQRQITAAELPERPKMRQVAAWLGVTYATARQMALDGAIPCKKIKRRANNVYLFDRATLLEWERSEGVA